MVAIIQLHLFEGHREVAFLELTGGGPVPRVGDRISVRGERYRVNEVLHRLGDESIITEEVIEVYVESVTDEDKLTKYDPEAVTKKSTETHT